MDDVAPASGVVVADGYDLVIRVVHKRLVVEDGVGPGRRVRRFHRATGRMRRVVVIGSSGIVSLEALRWLADVRAAFVQLDRRGRVIAVYGPPGTDRPKLRRAQALAGVTPVGVDLSRRLIDAKLAGQCETLGAFTTRVRVDDALAAIDEQRAKLAEATTVDELRICEAWAAAAYWMALSNLEVAFARRDASRIPDHWKTVGSRSSPLANGPRIAANPAQAIVNYLAGCLAAEAVLAARAVGLDAGLGVLHVDQPFRDSLAYDLVEPVRPKLERDALELVTSRPLSARDFVERRSGQCLVTAPLTHELAETLPRWRQLVGGVAEDFAAALETGEVPTPITGRRRASGRPSGPRSRSAKPTSGRRCGWCGGKPLPRRATCSDECAARILDAKHQEFAAASSKRMRKLDRSTHPAMTAEANARRSETRRAQRAAELAWNREHPETPDSQFFKTVIAPTLDRMSARSISRKTGLSVSYCAQIKRGQRVPHPRWWAVLDRS